MESQKYNWHVFQEDENQQNTMAGKIKQIGNMAVEQKNWDKVAEKYGDDLVMFSKYLGANEIQTAVFLAVFYTIYFTGGFDVTVGDLMEFFAVKQIMFMQHKKDIMKMRSMGIMTMMPRRRMKGIFDDNDSDRNTSFHNIEFSIPESVVQSIVEGKELKK